MIFDVIIIAIFALSIMICYKKGFAVSLFNTGSSVLSLILISVLKNPLTSAIRESEFGKAFYNDLTQMFYDNYVTSTNELKDIDTLPDFLTDSINTSIDTTSDIIGYLSDRTFDIIIFVVSFIILLILVKLIIKISPKVIKLITKLPVIKQFDKFFGICFGIITGCIWTLLFVNIMSIISIYSDIEFFAVQISSSYIVDFISTLKLNLFLS